MNLNTPLLNLDGNEFEDKATLKTVILGALINPIRGDEGMAPEAKVACFRLMMKVNDKADDCSFTAEETTLIKDRVGRAYLPLVVGRVYQAIDPASI